MQHRRSVPALALLLLTACPTDGGGGGDDDDDAFANSLPVVIAFDLEPDFPRTNEVVVATARAQDADGDPVVFTYRWFVDDVEVQGVTGPELDGALHFDKHARVRADVVPFDGTDEGSAFPSSPVEVLNTPPGVPQVTIEPAFPGDSDTLLCRITRESVDDDLDTVSYTIEWRLNLEPYDGAPGTTTLDGDTIDAGTTGVGDIWTCVVTPHDGEDPGSEVLVSVTVQ